MAEDKLATVDPQLRERVLLVLDVMARLGHPMVVTDGMRTVEQQQALYAKGRTTPGKVVTYADGIHKRSRHQSGRAVDCAFRTAAGRVSWDGPWETYGTIAETLGLVWGGRWKMADKPHVELREETT